MSMNGKGRKIRGGLKCMGRLNLGLNKPPCINQHCIENNNSLNQNLF